MLRVGVRGEGQKGDDMGHLGVREMPVASTKKNERASMMRGEGEDALDMAKGCRRMLTAVEQKAAAAAEAGVLDWGG